MEDTIFLDESLAVLNESKDFSFIQGKSKQPSQKTLDITFAGGNENGRGQKTSSSSQRSSLGQSSMGRKSKGSMGRARWSLPSDESLNDGLSVSERYAQRKLAKTKSSEELGLEALKK